MKATKQQVTNEDPNAIRHNSRIGPWPHCRLAFHLLNLPQGGQVPWGEPATHWPGGMLSLPAFSLRHNDPIISLCKPDTRHRPRPIDDNLRSGQQVHLKARPDRSKRRSPPSLVILFYYRHHRLWSRRVWGGSDDSNHYCYRHYQFYKWFPVFKS